MPLAQRAAPSQSNESLNRVFVQAAHEFEAQLMKELLKPMTSWFQPGWERRKTPGSGGPMADFATQGAGTGPEQIREARGRHAVFFASLSRNEKNVGAVFQCGNES